MDFLKFKELKHYGIKGQKWGDRNFQNEDGSLTPAGKARYASESTMLDSSQKLLGDASSGFEKMSKLGTNTIKSKTIKKDYSELTDAQLKERVNRLSLESNYGRLTGDTKTVRSGADWTRETLQNVGIVAGIGLSVAGIYSALYKTRMAARVITPVATKLIK